MIVVIGVIGISLIITGIVYGFIHMREIEQWFQALKWVQDFQEWGASLPEFVQLFLVVLLLIVFGLGLFKTLEKVY